MGKSLETNFDHAIARSDVLENEINRLVRSPRRSGDIQFLHHLLSIDKNVETVFLSVESARVGESESQIVLAGTDREIDPEFAAMQAVTIKFRLLRAGNCFSGIFPPTCRQCINTMTGPDYDFRRGPPQPAFAVTIIFPVRVTENHPLRPGWPRADWKTIRFAFRRKLHGTDINAITPRIRIPLAKRNDFQGVLTRLQTVFVIKDLRGAQSGIPVINRHNLFCAVQEDFGPAAERVGAADQTHLIAVKNGGDGRAVFADVKMLLVPRPIAFIKQCGGVEHGLGILAGNDDFPGAVVTDLNDGVAIGQSSDGETIACQIAS